MFIDIHSHVYRILPMCNSTVPPFCTPKQLLERYDKMKVDMAVLLPIVNSEIYFTQMVEDIVEVCQQLANRGVRVICAGLDMDYLGKPFGPMPYLMAVAEYVTKVHAICVKCGNLAQHSHRLSGSDKLVELGEKDTYEPICRHCFAELAKQGQ
jgi:thymidine kinase